MTCSPYDMLSVKSALFSLVHRAFKIILIFILLSACLNSWSIDNKNHLSKINYHIENEIFEWTMIASMVTGGYLITKSSPWFTNPAISESNTNNRIKNESFPNWTFAIIGPALVSAIILIPNSKGQFNDITYVNSKGILQAWSLTFFLTQTVKHSVGRKRPDYNERVLRNYNVEDGLYSFWSGHASSSFTLSTYSSLYILEHIGDWDNPYSVVVKIISSSLLMTGATWISISRIEDNRHYKSDVIVGSLVGASIAFIVYGFQNEWFYKKYDRRESKGLDTVFVTASPEELALSIRF